MTLPLWGFALGTLVLFGFSLWDDLFSLSWRTQIFFQIALGLILFLFNVRILFVTNPFGGVWSFASEVSLFPVFVVRLSITKAGEKMLTAQMAEKKAAIAEVLSVLSHTDRRALHSILKKLVSHSAN
jgi:hypothetical protein